LQPVDILQEVLAFAVESLIWYSGTDFNFVFQA